MISGEAEGPGGGSCDEVREALVLLGKAKAERAMKKAVENYVPSIRKERYLSGDEVCNYLHLSPRTLQTLRDTRQISYTIISGRVFLYHSLRPNSCRSTPRRITLYIELYSQ